MTVQTHVLLLLALLNTHQCLLCIQTGMEHDSWSQDLLCLGYSTFLFISTSVIRLPDVNFVLFLCINLFLSHGEPWDIGFSSRIQKLKEIIRRYTCVPGSWVDMTVSCSDLQSLVFLHLLYCVFNHCFSVCLLLFENSLYIRWSRFALMTLIFFLFITWYCTQLILWFLGHLELNNICPLL